MRSNYKQLGNYISQVDKRNTDLSISEPKGIRINKEFMPSVANTTGTDLSRYKVVSRGQFAYNPMHVGRDEILPISLLIDNEPIIVSPAYVVFEIINAQELDPEYLMMWCRRPEFDRNVWFTTDSSVRGGFSWESFCALELPVPSIEKQREIVKEYNTIVNRIKLNEQLNQKLEETAQTLYKHCFVDFEFPISKEYAQSISKLDLEGKPYQSNGGELVWNEELDKEIPEGWEVCALEEIVELIISHRGKSKPQLVSNSKQEKYQNPIISAMNVSGGKIVKHNTIKYVDDSTYHAWMIEPLAFGDIIMTSEAPMGELLLIAKRNNYLLSQRLYGIRADKIKSRGVFLYFWLQSPNAKRELEGRATGTTVLGIKLSELKKVLVLCPPSSVLEVFESRIIKVMMLKEIKEEENILNNALKNMILAKISKVEIEKELA